MAMIVRPATLADLPAISTIYGWSVENESASYEEVAPSLDTLRERMVKLLDRQFPYLVATVRDAETKEGEAPSEVVGYAYASPFRARAGYRYTVEDTVYVAPNAQRLGVGRALLTQLITACGDAGYREMLAVIGGSNPGPSVALHERCGFAEVGRLPSIGFKFGEWHDVLMLQRSLVRDL